MRAQLVVIAGISLPALRKKAKMDLHLRRRLIKAMINLTTCFVALMLPDTDRVAMCLNAGIGVCILLQYGPRIPDVVREIALIVEALLFTLVQGRALRY
jgi:hypothetical protein